MSNRRRKRGPGWDQAGEHPIAWFSALLRGNTEADPALVERAQAELERLGYFVVPYPPRSDRGEGTAR